MASTKALCFSLVHLSEVAKLGSVLAGLNWTGSPICRRSFLLARLAIENWYRSMARLRGEK